MAIRVPQLMLMLMDAYPTRYAVLSELTPSDISSLGCAFPLLLSDSEKERYCMLHREFPIYADWIESEISEGHSVGLVGKDLYTLQESVDEPLKYWSTRTHKTPIVIWLVVVEDLMSQRECELIWTHKKTHRTILSTRLVHSPGETQDVSRLPDQSIAETSQYEQNGTVFVIPDQVADTDGPLHGWLAKQGDHSGNTVVLFYGRSNLCDPDWHQRRMARATDHLSNDGDLVVDDPRHALTCYRRVCSRTEVVVGKVCPYVELQHDRYRVVSLPHRYPLDYSHVYLDCGIGPREPFNIIAIF